MLLHKLYSLNTNISGNIIKHNLRTSMNERTHFFIKICISHTLFSNGLMFPWCVKDGGRDIYPERSLLLPISSSGSQGLPTRAPPCKLVRDAMIDCVPHARLQFSAVCPNLTSYTPVRTECLIILSCLLIPT